ncbi:MAG: DUF488 family protein [Prevotella sp.]|nr:DUF488 family protein [Prevotella sp.]MDY4040031.1 DUF488 family protein [Prevotella sp.]
MMSREIRIKRVYEAADSSDGFRVLVDRLWPRGISRQKAAVALWEKELAPSNELRKWFGHDPSRFETFAARYREELRDNPALAPFADQLRSYDVITLLFGAADQVHNNAVVLRDVLMGK